MAVRNGIEMRIDMRQNTNTKSEQYGNWYPQVSRLNTMSTRALAEHIADHGSLYTLDVVEGILRKLSICIPELVAQGVGVKLDGIGSFYPSAQTVKYGKASKQAVRDANPTDVVKGIHVRFKPEGTKLDRLTSDVFKQRCLLTWGNFVTVTTTTRGDGTKEYHHSYEPINEYETPPTP